MRKFLIVSLTLLVITKSAPKLPLCNVDTAKLALNPRLFAETTIDGPRQNVYITRFFHNKINIFSSEFAMCYFKYFDAVFIYELVGAFGVLGFYYFAYFAARRKLIFALTILATIPILPFFNLPLIIVIFTTNIFAIIGLVILIKR